MSEKPGGTEMAVRMRNNSANDDQRLKACCDISLGRLQPGAGCAALPSQSLLDGNDVSADIVPQSKALRHSYQHL